MIFPLNCNPRHSRMEGGTGPVSMMPAMATLSVKAFGEDNGVRKIMNLADSEPAVIYVWLCRSISSTKTKKLVDNFNSVSRGPSDKM